jgi:hypothetical protein
MLVMVYVWIMIPDITYFGITWMRFNVRMIGVQAEKRLVISPTRV